MSAAKEKTKVQLAQVHSKSLRTTIPAGIVRQFAIEEGTELEWEIVPKDNQLMILVHPAAILDHAAPESKTAGESSSTPRPLAARRTRTMSSGSLREKSRS